VEEFLARELPGEQRTVREDGWIIGFSREFSRKLGARGWIGLTRPRRHGGQERSPLDRLVLTEIQQLIIGRELVGLRAFA
jgi:acyl-CoA dehydrogenase